MGDVCRWLKEQVFQKTQMVLSVPGQVLREKRGPRELAIVIKSERKAELA
jgi:hypothetical protein